LQFIRVLVQQIPEIGCRLVRRFNFQQHGWVDCGAAAVLYVGCCGGCF
jgi:hypothetical protein